MKDRRTTKPKKKYSKISTQVNSYSCRKDSNLFKWFWKKDSLLPKLLNHYISKDPLPKSSSSDTNKKEPSFIKKWHRSKPENQLAPIVSQKLKRSQGKTSPLSSNPMKTTVLSLKVRPSPSGQSSSKQMNPYAFFTFILSFLNIRVLCDFSYIFRSQHPHLKLATHTRSQPSFQATPAFVKLTNSHRYALNLEYRKLIMVARHAQTGALLFANTLWMIL